MTRYPHIPMHPNEVPQQRVHAVVDLPRRPDGFVARCDFWDPIAAQDAPSGDPKGETYLCTTEWAWSPHHTRIDAYYIERRASHWLLWIGSEDENSWDREWRWTLYGYAPPEPFALEDVAIWMLMDCWASEAEHSSFDHFHWIDEAGLLSVAQINAMGRSVWPGAQNEPVSSTVGG